MQRRFLLWPAPDHPAFVSGGPGSKLLLVRGAANAAVAAVAAVAPALAKCCCCSCNCCCCCSGGLLLGHFRLLILNSIRLGVAAAGVAAAALAPDAAPKQQHE